MTRTAVFAAVLASALALAAGTSALAQSTNKFGQHEVPPGVPPEAMKPLVEKPGVVSWKTLAQVDLIKQKNRYVPQFSDSVNALNRKNVKVQGFMLPLSVGDKQTHFVLASTPQTCNYCLPGGPEAFVEVRSKKPVKYTFEPIVMSGRMEILREDPTGVFYRLTEALPE